MTQRPVPIKKIALTFFVVSAAFMRLQVQAAEMKNVTIADQAPVGGKNLVLNGLGMRQKTIFHVDVYVGALYLEKKSHDPAAILASPEEKRIELAFVHSATLGQIQDGFNESYESSCKPDCEALKAPFEKLKNLMQPIAVGDRLAFDVHPKKVDVWIKGKMVGSIEDAKFPEALVRSWIGEHPPTEGLRAGMLGIKE